MAPKNLPKRLKRSLPPRKDQGIDPRLVALGGIGGGAFGLASNRGRARRSVARDVAAETKWNMENLRSNMDAPTQTNRAAGDVYDAEYSKMPRAKNQGAVDLFGNLRKSGNEYSAAKRLSGISNSDMNRLQAKRLAKVSRGNSTATRMAGAAELRAKRTRRASGVKGAIGGAALAALVQLVAKELGKKK